MQIPQSDWFSHSYIFSDRSGKCIDEFPQTRVIIDLMINKKGFFNLFNKLAGG